MYKMKLEYLMELESNEVVKRKIHVVRAAWHLKEPKLKKTEQEKGVLDYDPMY